MVKEAYIPENVQRGFRFKLWNNQVSPFHRNIIEHRHLQFEIVLIKSGKGLYATKSGNHDIQKDDIFIFASNEQHCVTDIFEGEDFKFMNIHFEPRYVWGSSNNGLSNDAMNMCFTHNENFCNRLPRNNPYTDKIRQLVLEIELEIAEKAPEYQLMVHNKVYEILVILARHLGYGTGNSISAEQYRHIKAVRSVIDIINRHLSEELTLDELAKAVDLSPNYFSHIFKKTVGVSLWDYITSKRIELAMAMLHDQTDRNMLDIAADCGFNNSANFNKMFRKITGLTPTQFRRHQEYIG